MVPLDHLDHLEPGGIFAMAVGDLQLPEQEPRHAPRLASIVRKALEDRGVEEPWRHVMVIGTGSWNPFTHTLVRNDPFTEAEVERLVRFAADEGFQLWHRPDRPFPTLLSRILRVDGGSLQRMYAAHPLDLEPTTDDSPFFFNFYKWRTLARAAWTERVAYDRTLATGQIVLVGMLLQSVLFAALLILLPPRRVPRGEEKGRGLRAAYLAYFAAPLVFDALLGAPLALRIAVSVALLLPPGLVLGSFFPLGSRMAERTNAALAPWARAVNGCATVVGTVVAVMTGMTWSFTAVTLLAMAVYAAGVSALWAAQRAAPVGG